MKYITLPCSVHRLETVLVEKKKNHKIKIEDSKPTSTQKTKFKCRCNTCGKDGHKARKCNQNPIMDTLQFKEGGCKARLMLNALPPGILPSSYVTTRDDARHGLTSWISIAIAKGKNRQVRRMTATVGHATLRLMWVQTGQIILGGMEEGEVRVLAQSDIEQFNR